MELEIQIVRDPCRDEAKQRLRVFAENGGTIGRAPDSYWRLPDPKCYLSGHHCDVEYEGDGFWVRDTSRNGVFLNDATDRVGYGYRVRLDDGDRLRVGLYELVVKVRDHGRPVTRAREELDGAAVAAAQVDEQLGRTTVNLHSSQGGEHSSPSGVVGGMSNAPLAVARESRAPLETAMNDVAVSAVVSDLPLSSTGSHSVVRVDRVAMREIGLLPPEAQERLVANQFRQIKRALIANALGKGVTAVPNGRLLMVTSALPGEGKTFSTINLALSLAREKDMEVVVVDADVAKPQISGLFKLEKAPGLLDALSDESIAVESLVYRTDVKGLCILPAGRCNEDVATELLASARMEDTVRSLGARCSSRIILFDSPPILLTNEARVIATLVGQIVLIVRAGGTPQPAVLEAIGYLGEDKPIGVVLNQSMATAGSYYGYGAYGYGGYGEQSGNSGRSGTE